MFSKGSKTIGLLGGILLLTLASLLVLAACGGSATSTSPPPAATAIPAATQAPAPTAVPAATTKPAATARPAPTEAPTKVPEAMAKAVKFPTPGVDGVPLSVDKATVAVENWGGQDMNPVSHSAVNFLMDYFATFLLMRDEEHNIVSGLLVDWEAAPEGFSGTIHPDAMWHDGKPITAEDIQWNYYAQRGDFEEFAGHMSATRFEEEIEEVQIIDDKRFFVKTTKPILDFVAYYSGSGYHQVYQGPPHILQEMGRVDFENDPQGGGPYTVKEWKPNDRIVFERWDDFWGDTPWYHKPQHKELEILWTGDAAARFALLKSDQADMIATVSFGLAKDMPYSDEYIGRGINPGQGEPWVQILKGTGNYLLGFPDFEATIPGDAVKQLTYEEALPFSDIRVREALELAVDKVAISEKAQFGLSEPMTGLWFGGTIGYREGEVSPYDPEKAKKLLAEAGYPDGFEFDIYWGAWGATPGELSWLEAAAGYWKGVGLDASIFEIDAQEHANQCCSGQAGERPRGYGPVTVRTMGRQDHAATLVNYFLHRDAVFAMHYDDVTDGWFEDLYATTDPEEHLRILADIEDRVLENRWLIPMAEDSMAMGYSDRVLAHPHSPFFANSFGWLWRLVMRD